MKKLILPIITVSLYVAVAINQGLRTAHILFSTIAFGIFCLAALQALLLALQEQQLKHKHLTGIIQILPPLQTMETLLFQLINTGFIVLSLVLLTSTLFFDNLFAPHLIRKTISAILVWLLFGSLILGRRYLGWRSTTAIRWTIGSFLLLVLVYFGGKLL